MKQNFLLSLVIFVLLLGGCSTLRDDQNSNRAKELRQKRELIQAEVDRESKTNYISTENLRLKIDPEVPTVKTDLKIVVEGIADQQFEYLWVVNQKKIDSSETTGEVLPAKFFKRGDWVQCWVRIKNDSLWHKSSYIQIANSVPDVDVLPVREYRLPATINYQIVATDADGDQLSYNLESELPGVATLDSKSGLFTWKLEEKDLEKISPEVEVRFLVSDQKGGEVRFSMKFSFKPQKEEQK